MGKGFGQLAYVRGIVKYSLSPFEQRAFAGFISKGVPNFVNRCIDSGSKILPAFLVSYVVFTQTEKRHEELGRKNPADFANDE